MQQDQDRVEDFDDKRHEQLTTAPKAVESDAAPRVEVTEQEDGVTGIDVADTASVRPGKPSPTRDA
jgi:hypothetical protein